MLSLLVATLAFLAIHFAVSGTALRGRLVGLMGEGAYLGVFSAVSLALIVWIGASYGPSVVSEANSFLWTAPDWWPHLTAVAVLIAFLLAVIGMASSNPGAVGQAAQAAKAPEGIQRITRHPFLWGVALWAAFHLVGNGDLASLILFGGFLVLSLAGTAMIDAKRSRSHGASWNTYAERTSNVPFAAILAGRQRLNLVELGWWRLLLAVALYGAAYALHPALFGVSPN